MRVVHLCDKTVLDLSVATSPTEKVTSQFVKLFNNIYPEIRHLIKLEQHGFMKSCSTVSQMIMYLDAVYSSRDTNSSAVSVYFDISKAFIYVHSN